MLYINKISTDNGNYGTPSSHGEIALPDELLDSYIATMGFAVLTLDGDTVTEVERNEEAYESYLAAHPTIVPTPAEQREEAYNTEKIIPWGEKSLTVTEAAQLWQYYAAEGDTDTTAELSALIADAKSKIREEYPDERTVNNE